MERYRHSLEMAKLIIMAQEEGNIPISLPFPQYASEAFSSIPTLVK